MLIEDMLNEVRQGKLHSVTKIDNISYVNQYVQKALMTEEWDIDMINKVEMILIMSNILYNNSSRNTILIEDGVYDLLLEKFKQYKSNYPIGGEPVRFKEDEIIFNKEEENKIPWSIVTNAGDMMYYQDIIKNDHQYEFNLNQIPPWYIKTEDNVNMRNVPHNNLELVGTLDKCKFVLSKDAIEAGVYNDPKVKIFERDFIGKHLRDGIIYPDSQITMIGEAKYDGIGIDAIISDGMIQYANTRGDVNNDKTVDLTPFLEGYTFPRMDGMIGQVGVQFEAIILTPYLNYLREHFGLNYVNSRNAVIGISSRKDAKRFRDYITLVPLKTDILDSETGMHLDRLVEIDFLNEYIAREVNLKYSIFSGDYVSVLFQVKKFVEEMEYMRSYLPFMYDGVVVSYYGDEIRRILGRENFVDKFSMAIKFSALKKETIFLGYKYTIGQNGVITPMIYYNPVEFYGGIHDHSSGHSYARFMELGLRVGDVIQVEYTNDVMPYVTKMDIQVNKDNLNPVVPFIQNCPYCGCPIEISESNKSARCPNIECRGRAIARLSNMVSKLDLRDFGEQSMILLEENLKATSLSDLFGLTVEDVSFLGPNNSIKFIDRIKHLKEDPIYDYDIVGSLGFTNIAKSKWKVILNQIPLTEIVFQYDCYLNQALSNIKGIGKATIDTILTERKTFFKDLETILAMHNIIPTYHTSKGMKIRFTGIRDKELVKRVSAMGHDIGEGAVTKDTDILIVPNEEFKSTKTYQAQKYGTIIIPYKDFLNNIDQYLTKL